MAEEVRIRYILGAGASANAIPTVRDFAGILNLYSAKINSYSREFPKLATLSNWFNEISKQIQTTFSIDTLAKMYWFRRDLLGYNKIKTVIAVILNLLELDRDCDRRYDAFLSALLQRDGQFLNFPSSIQLVSWNYDFQFASSHRKILNLDIDEMNNVGFMDTKNILPLTNLNGSAFCEGTYKVAKPFLNYRIPLSQDGANVFLAFQEELVNAVEITNEKSHWGNIKFSWEEDLSLDEVMAFKPDVTVVIGYSFPTFNRQVDTILMNHHPRRVYLQCNYFDHTNNRTIDGNKEVTTKLIGMGVHRDVIKPLETSTEFHIPFEFGADANSVSWPFGAQPSE